MSEWEEMWGSSSSPLIRVDGVTGQVGGGGRNEARGQNRGVSHWGENSTQFTSFSSFQCTVW